MPPKSRFKQQGKPSDSSGQQTPSTARGQIRDNLIVASKVIEGISEATDLLKPLKATCQVLRLVLETNQVCSSGSFNEEK
jgi:conjugal transfer/entry exclusion protein